MARRTIGWTLVSHAVPLFSLYALLFAHAGLSDGEISALFTIWSAVSIVVETPSGALADRYSRRGALVAAGVLQAGGYALWTAFPAFPAFAAGFALWGLGGSLASGAFEALLYDGLAAAGAEGHYARLLGRVNAVALLAQPPTALAAAGLYAAGGYPLVGWVSVASCLLAAALAARLPEPSHAAPAGDPAADGATAEPHDPDGPGGYLTTLRSGFAEAVARPEVRRIAIAVAALTAVDALEEYFPLLARDWGVPTALNPVAVLGIPLAGAAGAALGGRAWRLRPRAFGVLLATGGLALGAASLVARPAGLALVALFYGLYRLVLVVADARLQERIDGAARATVTSVAGLGTEVATFGVYAAWTAGGLPPVTAALLVLAAALPRLLGGRRPARQ